MQHDFILLDRSGSMGGIWDEAIKAIASYVQKLDQDKVPTKVTFAVFDSPHVKLDYTIVCDAIDVSDWKAIEGTNVAPRGGTPLNDAIGRMVGQALSLNPERCSIMIVTDGHENSSVEVSRDQANAMLDQCKAKGWDVTFIGADFRAVEQQGQQYGIISGKTISAGVGNMRDTMAFAASNRAEYGLTGQSVNFSDEVKGRMADSKHAARPPKNK